MKRTCLLKDFVEVMEGLEREGVFYDETIIEEDEEGFATVVSDLRVVIPALKMEFREGYGGIWQEDEEYYMPDFSVTVLYKEGASPDAFLAWERDCPIVVLYNYTHKSMEELEQLECILLLDE